MRGEVHVGAQVVDPEGLGPRRLAGRLPVEEQVVGFHSLGVEHARRQAEKGMHVTLVQQASADSLASAALEEHVVWHDDGGTAVQPDDRCQ